MTEAEWLACDEPGKMVRHPREHCRAARCKNGRRKLRLFACFCCRRVWNKLTDESVRGIVQVAEALADGVASPAEAESARSQAGTYPEGDDGGEITRDGRSVSRMFFEAVLATTHSQPRTAATDIMFYMSAAAARTGPGYDERWASEWVSLARLLYEIFGNPFRPSPPLPPAVIGWNDRTVPCLAEAVYEERKLPEGTFDTGHLAILADALLDAGCEDDDLIQHCRSEGPHVRGCWAVDLCLGKS